MKLYIFFPIFTESEKDTFLDGVFISSYNKLVLTNGVTLGMRSDYNGVLLFDTILQPTAQKSYDVVEIELPLFEVSPINKILVLDYFLEF